VPAIPIASVFPEASERLLVPIVPGLVPGDTVPVPVPVRFPIDPVPRSVPPDTANAVVCGLELARVTTPLTTLVVVFVLAPESVVVPEPLVSGVRAKPPDTTPARTMLPVPASNSPRRAACTASRMVAPCTRRS
jgi:hypothetical protein